MLPIHRTPAIDPRRQAAIDAIAASVGGGPGRTSSQTTLQGQFDQLWPDHSGAMFDFLTRGSRLASRRLADDSSIYSISPVSGWLEPLYFKGSKGASGTPAWTDSGFGLSMGLEQTTRLGNLGVSFAWVGGNVHDGTWHTLKANSYELGGFWRVSKGPFYAFAKLAADRVTAGSTRVFSGTVGGSALSYTATGRWSGWAVTSSGGASYKLDVPGHLSLKRWRSSNMPGCTRTPIRREMPQRSRWLSMPGTASR